MSDADGRSRLTDKIGIISADATDYPDIGDTDHATTVSIGNLRKAMELLETLGWETIDIGVADPDVSDADNPLLILEPPHGGLFASTKQASISVAPVSGSGREKTMD